MSEEGGKMNRDAAAPATAIAFSGEPLLANYCYGTFQGVASYQSPPPLQSHPVFGFPQPIPPPAVCAVPPCYFPHGYQTVQGYAVAEGRPIREHRLPCCGMGIGWFLFIIGFFLGAIPWYIGAFLLLCVRLDYREKPGFIACTLAVSLFISCNMNSLIYLKMALSNSFVAYAICIVALLEQPWFHVWWLFLLQQHIQQVPSCVSFRLTHIVLTLRDMRYSTV